MHIPRHVAFIMDGNGRWAQARGLPRSAGHKAGYERIRSVLETCAELGVEIVSCYAWSTENWGRPQDEVDYILRAVEEQLPRFASELRDRQVRFIHSGSRQGLPDTTRRALELAERTTRSGGPRVFNLVFNYGGRAEIVHAAQLLLRQRRAAASISEAEVGECLWTHGLPDVDLLVRTGGDQRLSNFLLWQSAHAVLHFVDAYWPAISRQDIDDAMIHYDREIAAQEAGKEPAIRARPVGHGHIRSH